MLGQFTRDSNAIPIKIAHKKLIKPESGIIKTGYTTSLEDGDGDSDATDRRILSNFGEYFFCFINLEYFPEQ